MTTYTLRIVSTTTSQVVCVQAATPLLAALLGLERLAIRSLDQVRGLQIDPVADPDPVSEPSGLPADAGAAPEGEEEPDGRNHHD